MSENQKHFPEGIFFKLPSTNAPDFVKGSVSIKVAELQEYLTRVQGEWLNIDLKVSKEGKAYAEVNTFKPDKSKAKKEEPSYDYDPDKDSDSLPF